MPFLVLSTSLREGSRSRVLAQHAQQALHDLGHDASFVDLRNHPLPLCDGGPSYEDPEVAKLESILQTATGIIVAAPIYNFYLSAALKNVVEMTGDAWEGKTVGFLCAAGGQASYMSSMDLSNSLMLDYRTLIVPRFVYATGASFDDQMNLTDNKVAARIRELATTLVALAPTYQDVFQSNKAQG